MKRPILLTAVLTFLVAGLVSLFVWLSVTGSTGGVELTGPRATSSGDASLDGVAQERTGTVAGDLLAPEQADAQRAVTAAASAAGGPTVALAGRVVPPPGCAFDDSTEVLALDREASLDDALRALEREPRPNDAERDPFGFDDGESAPWSLRIVARAPIDAAGAFRLDVPQDVELVHVLAAGRSWYARSTEAVRPASAGSVALIAHCGAWIEGTVAVPAGRDVAEVEGLAVRVETAIEGMSGPGQGFEAMRRRVKVENGRFEARALDPEQGYDVSAEPERLAATTMNVGELAAGRARPVVLAFLEGGTVRGSVRDPEGKPLADARVRADRRGRWFGFDDRAVREGRSGADGAFELVGVMPGQLEVKARLDGWLVEKNVKIEVKDGAVVDGVALTMTRGAAIAGTLHWSDGTPAQEIEVDVTFDRSQMGGMGVFNALKGGRGEAKTDPEGRFRVDGLGNGPFTVEARALSAADREALADAERETKRRREHRARADGVKPGTLDLALVLRPPTGVRGRVVDAADAPVTAFRIAGNAVGTGMLAEVGQEQRSQEFADERGEFLLDGLHDGHWKLRASAEGYAESDAVELTLPLAAQAPETVIRLVRAASVRGVVVGADGAAVSGADVRIDDGQPEWVQRLGSGERIEVRSGEGGRFELKGLKAGRIAVYADHREFARSPDLPLELAAGQVVEDARLALRVGGTLTGEVYDNGKPAPGMLVQLQETKRFTQTMSFTDAKGRFRAEHLDPGSYQVVAMPARGDAMVGAEGEFDPMSMMSSMKMATADIADGVESHVVLGAPPEDPVRVSGRVTQAGAPVASSTVMFLPSKGRKGLSGFKPVRTGKDGSYALTLDAPGVYSVSVQRMSAQMDAQSVHEVRADIPKAESHEFDIALPEGRISGRVLGADGQPLVHTRVSIVLEGSGRPGTLWGGQYHELRTDDAGEYDGTGLEPGTYSVMAGGAEFGGLLGDGASARGGREVRGGLKLDRGEWMRGVDFRLKAPGTAEVRVLDEDGKPISGATVFARNENGHAVDAFSFVTTDGSGVGRYAGLAAGRYSFRARTSGASSGESALVKLDEGGKAEVEIRLERSSILLVKVVDAEKKPLIAAVEVYDADGREIGNQLGLSEIMERFQSGGFDFEEQRFGPFPPGKYRVKATIEGGKSATKPVSLSGQAERKITVEID